jgi:hypothetical protein
MAGLTKSQYRHNLKRVGKAFRDNFKKKPVSQSALIVGKGHVKIDGHYYNADVSGNIGDTVTVTNIGRPSAAIYSTAEAGVISSGATGTFTASGGGGGSSIDPSLLLFRDGRYSLTGHLDVAPNIKIDGVDISAHAVDANAHHAKVHDIAGGDHTITSAKWGIIGAIAVDTLGIITPSSDPGATEAVLKSDSSGFLTLPKLVATTKVTTPLIDTTSGPLTLSPAGTGVKIDNANGTVGSVQINSIGNFSPSNIRGSIIFSRNSDLSFDGSNWQKTSGASDAVGIFERYPGQLSIYTLVSTTTFADLSDNDFRSNYERVTVDQNGNVGFSVIEPSYRIDAAGDIRATGDMRADTSLLTPLITTATNTDLLINPDGNGLVLFPTDQTLKSVDFSSSFPITGWQINEVPGITGKSALTIGAISADEMYVKIFVADETRIRRGQQYWTYSNGLVSRDFIVPDSIGGTVRIYFENSPAIDGAIFVNDDWLLLQYISNAGGGFILANVWGQVSSYIDEGDGEQSWLFTLRAASAGALEAELKKGTEAIDFGAPGAALIQLSVVDAAGSPYIDMRRWSGSDPYTPTNHVSLVKIGNLDGISNSYVTPNGDGIYIRSGAASDQFIVADDNGLQLRGADFTEWNGSDQTVLIASSNGSMKLGTDISSSDTTGFFFDGSTGDITIGSEAYSSNVTIYGQIFIANPSDIDTNDLTNGAGWTAGATWGTDLANQPDSLSDINAGEGSKLDGIEAEATVGAEWGENLSAIPGRFGDAPGDAGLYLTPTHMGYYDGSAWKAWISSGGQFYFGGSTNAHLEWNGVDLRGLGTDGTTVQWRASSTTGALYAGADNVQLSVDGINLQQDGYISPDAARAISWWVDVDTKATLTQSISAFFDALNRNVLSLEAYPQGGIYDTSLVQMVAGSASIVVESGNNIYLNATYTRTQHLIPQADDDWDLGSESSAYGDAYINRLHVNYIVGTPDYSHEHDAGDITSGTLSLARIPNILTGKDADTLDGYHAASFSLSGHTHSYLPLSGGTLTGNIAFGGAQTVDGVDISAFYTAYSGHNHDALYVPLARTVTAGTGMAGGGALSGNITLSHGITSTQASVNNSNYTFIQDVTLDTYGHVTALVSADASAMLSGYLKADGTVTGATSQKQVFTNGVDVGTSYMINATQVLYVPGGSFLGTFYFGDGGSSLTYGSGNDGRYITAVGLGTLKFNTTGSKNNAIGTNAMRNNTTGQINNAMGYNALIENTTGSYNNAVGSNSLDQNTTGSYNSAVGFQTLHSLVSGNYNTAVGYRAGWSTTGSSNIFIGANAGYSETGSNKLYIAVTNTASPLIYGDFSAGYITINGDLETDDLIANDNLDAVTILGRAKVGYAAATDSATFAHYDFNTSTNFGVAQYNTGAVVVNAPTGQQIGLAINAVDTLTINDTYVNPRGNMQVSAGDFNRKFSQVHAFEFIVDNLVASNIMATIGGRIIVSDTIYLDADMGSDSNYLNSEYASLQAGDFGYMAALIDGSPQVEVIRVIYGPTGVGPYSYMVIRDITASNTSLLNLSMNNTQTTINTTTNVFSPGDNLQLDDYPAAKVEIVTVTSTATSVSGGYQYTITRPATKFAWSASAGVKRITKNWIEGNAIVSTGGAVGDGYIELTSTQTILSQFGPTISITSRTDADVWNGLVEVVALGNLRSRVDYGSSDVSGLVIGNDASLTPTSGFRGITADATDGIRLFSVNLQSFDGSVQTADLSPTGDLKLGTAVSDPSTTTFDFDSATGATRIGPYASGKANLNWSGSDLELRIYNATFIKLAGSGAATFEGAISLGTSGGLYQGTGTFASPTTGLKLWRDSGVGRIGGYNAGTLQWYGSTDGKLYAGGGDVYLSADGLGLNTSSSAASHATTKAVKFFNSGYAVGGLSGYSSGVLGGEGLILSATNTAAGAGDDISIDVTARSTTGTAFATITAYHGSLLHVAKIQLSGSDVGSAITIEADTTTITGNLIMSLSGADIDMNGNDIYDIGKLGDGWLNLSGNYGSGWTSYGSGYQVPQYRAVGDLIFLRGLVARTAGVGITICTMPSGYRIADDDLQRVETSSGPGSITIAPSGTINLTTGGATWVSLSGVIFSKI